MSKYVPSLSYLRVHDTVPRVARRGQFFPVMRKLCGSNTVIRFLSLTVLPVFYVFGNDSLKIEWLFENEFEKEYLSINEAVTVVPQELEEALELYRTGAFRRAADILYQVRRLNLPDGTLDFIAFALAECYRRLDLQSKAIDEYRFVASRFPDTDKRAPALFRMLEYAAHESNVNLVDSIRTFFSGEYRNHPLLSSVLYESGKLYYSQERYSEALELLKDIPASSSRHLQATFLSALCHVQLKEWDGALSLLKYVWHHSKDPDMRAEAVIVTGDIHYRNRHNERAMEFYRKVPRKSVRYEYALVKIARCLFDSGKFEKAAEIGRNFIQRRSDSKYFFEMASILEQALTGSGKDREAAEIGSRIHTQIAGARITFEIFDEIDRLTDILQKWQTLEYQAIALRNSVQQEKAIAGKKRSEDLQHRLRLFLNEINRQHAGKNRPVGAPHLAERRYIAMLKKNMDRIDDTLAAVRNRIARIDSAVGRTVADSSTAALQDSLRRRFDTLESGYRDIEHEHALVIDKCLGGEAEEKQESEEMQAKFIDWEFMKYLEKKEQLIKLSARLAGKKRRESGSATADSAGSATGDTVKAAVVTEADKIRLEQTIADERIRLIGHIETMADIYPKSRYASAALFRLAELYMDESARRFEKAMIVYEKKLVEENDSGTSDFPEYDLHEAIATYHRIHAAFPNDRYADDALFYGALALRKQGLEDSAYALMVQLIDEYPQSEYYIEANMNIGRYHFEHPKKFGKDGYKLAEEAFRNVLFYRDHPQFVQALYHLGWCYYMQDRYDEAIAAFKYLIEEVELDFDPLRKDEMEVKNPLLRAEAIDYLAISFDQEGDSAHAVDFLKLIGNDDYSAMIFNRMGELREEDLDFKTAIMRYRQCIANYPLSYSAPEAAARLIALYENANNQDAAAAERESFFNTYSAGSTWHSRIATKDSLLLGRIDSMVIAIGLSVADNLYRTADALGGDRSLLQKAAQQYRSVVDKYPKQKRSADAAWNLAAVLQKLGDGPGAYARFLEFSSYPGIDSTRRENAALEAIAIAQGMLPVDSLAPKGTMDFSGKKLIEAIDNYTKLFPEGSSYAKVLFTMGGVYFNRHLYEDAATIYTKIIENRELSEHHLEASQLLAQCRFGQEKWAEAAVLFEDVWKKTTDEARRQVTYNFLLQSCYFDAKQMMTDKKFDKAAAAFKGLDDRFPGSEYGDVAQFSAAEAYEKSEKWIKATERYFELVERYPMSKFAADALFNAAGDFEKTEKYARAAETYELLVSRYPESPKAKDGLFNLGFCYEKIGKIDAMVAANERYSTLYPEEKDVEALLMRSADYYAKTGMLEKAISLYRNFVRRFPQSPKAVEAYFMIGKCFGDRGDKVNAQMNFSQAEQHNMRLLQDGGGGNLYFASEAALANGNLISEKFSAVRLELPEDRLNAALKEKMSLLNEAVNAYQRVLQFRSEKLFEAACRMGELYEELAEALVKQDRLKTDPIKAALKENEIMTSASQLVQTSFVPYRKALDISKEFDSLSEKQREWVDRSWNNLSSAILQAGTYLYDGVGAMQNAPVPSEIRQQPLLYCQYRIKLLETLEPLKIRVLDYFTAMLDTLPQLGLDDSLAIVCEINVARLNYLIGSAGDRLAVEILKETDNLPKNLSESEREELLFQLEDIVFELQDKALVQLETARERILQRKLHDNTWYNKVIETLARLSPEKYGASFYLPVIVAADDTWFIRSDSVPGWKTAAADLTGWTRAVVVNPSSGEPRRLPAGVTLIGGKDTWQRMYVWKNVFSPGKPRDAKMTVCVPGNYKLFVNGVLTLSDTTGQVAFDGCDSATGIVSLFGGGDNIIACEVEGLASITKGIGIRTVLLADTTEHFATAVSLPKSVESSRPAAPGDTTARISARTAAVDSSSPKHTEKPDVKMSRKEVLAAIENYRRREREALAALRRERLAIQKLRILKEERDRKRQKEMKTTAPEAQTVPVPLPVPVQ